MERIVSWLRPNTENEMAVRKLKPVEDRDPYAAAVLQAFDLLGDEVKTTEQVPPFYCFACTATYSAKCKRCGARHCGNKNCQFCECENCCHLPANA